MRWKVVSNVKSDSNGKSNRRYIGMKSKWKTYDGGKIKEMEYLENDV